MDVDGATLPRDAEWWLRISEHEQPRQLLNRFIEQRRLTRFIPGNAHVEGLSI
jgi:hypothetical protein